jgi:hypothetical protein
MKMSHTWKLTAAIWMLLPVWAANYPATAIAVAQAASRNDAPSQDTAKADKKVNDSKPATPDASPKRDVSPLKKLTVHVRDPDGKPVAGAHVGLSAHRGTPDEPKIPAETDGDGFVYEAHRLTNARGVAELEIAGADLKPVLEDQGIVAREDKRHLVAIVHPDLAKLKDSLDVTLAPECRISGKVMSPELKKDEKPLGSTTVSLGDGDHVTLTFTSNGTGDYYFFVPPGQYLLDADSSNIVRTFAEISVPPNEHDLVFEPMVATPSKLALLEGRPAPELRGAVAWKNGPAPTIASLKGKCVLLLFWRPSSPDSLAAVQSIRGLYDKLKQHGLAVIGIAVDVDPDKRPIDSVQKLDDLLAKVRKETWAGRDIPFPVALVPPRPTAFGSNLRNIQYADSEPAADYGVTQYPTLLLIDRHGVLVNELDGSDASLASLQKTLGLKASPAAQSPSKPPATPPPAVKATPTPAAKPAPRSP